MIEKDPIGGDARRRRRDQRVPLDAACPFCGVRNLEALTAVRASLLEGHHVVGEANEPDLVTWVCRNHHALLHERLRDAGVDLHRVPSRNVLERVIGMLRALGALFAALGESMLFWAEQLAALVRELDLRYPGWRELGSASA